jgi:hypothetical protein
MGPIGRAGTQNACRQLCCGGLELQRVLQVHIESGKPRPVLIQPPLKAVWWRRDVKHDTFWALVIDELQHRFRVGVSEIIALEQQGTVCGFGERIGGAIRKI